MRKARGNIIRLTAKQAAFVREYLVDNNATQAAIRAGYSRKTAYSQGQRLLKHVEVAAGIAKRQAKLEERAGVKAEAVIRELALLGFANMQDYMRVTPDGDAYVDLSNLTQEQAAAVQEVTVDEYVEGRGEAARAVKRLRVKLADKRSALVDLGKHLGLFKREPGASNQVVIIHDGRAPMSVTTSGDGGQGDD